MSPLARLAVPAGILLACVCFAEETTPAVPSPDGKFVVEFVEPDDDALFSKTRIVAKATGNTVWESPDEANVTWARNVKCVWSPDSKQFALNFRAGGRYEATIYRWNGKAFIESPSFEQLFPARLDTAKGKQLQDLVLKLSPSFPNKQAVINGSCQHRIWDKFSVDRWIDNKTVQATGYSIRSVPPGIEQDDRKDISGSMGLVLRQGGNGSWKIIKEESIPLEEAQMQEP